MRRDGIYYKTRCRNARMIKAKIPVVTACMKLVPARFSELREDARLG